MPTTAPRADPAGEIQAVELRNNRGDSAVILTLGAILAELNIRTAQQGVINTVLGYDHPQSYLKDHAYHGVTAGRYCNRIAHSRFNLNSHTYTLANNEGAHHLHGGPAGFGRRMWEIRQQDQASVTLGLISEDGDQGYPGKLDVSLRYTLSDPGCLDISWEARSDQDTVVSLTNHSYFNLAGCGDIRNHQLRIVAAEFTPTGADMIPTGAIQAVAGSVLDLQDFTELGAILASSDPEVAERGGLDHNWARGQAGSMLVSAELLCPASGLLLQVSSTLPGLQCYTGNSLAANGIHGTHEGICLEPQYYPNSPNEPDFPSPLLRGGDCMRHNIRYQITEVD